ncbi:MULTISPECIES: hypothetical protein [Streptomyces]|uniref:Uncharacterized protein n=2 Tax=Streptomyces TaxID=1883 RepID=A0A100Y6M6_9ACTN|nr:MULTISPECIES: hypothetical protein [Streptomyces]KUH38654.1 hypothetical protein ATE80_11630 [Streptomyces kanasensis]UUS31157.1 hypothetical protein NRO40_10105 [Streptomyces changanensis]
MDEETHLRRHGLHPAGPRLDEVRAVLAEQTRLERGAQGDGDTELMKLCCVQLFNAGDPRDTPLVWAAKTASMDAGCSIETRLLCGAGLPETRAYLTAHPSPASEATLTHLRERAADFGAFTPRLVTAQYRAYYAD